MIAAKVEHYDTKGNWIETLTFPTWAEYQTWINSEASIVQK